MSNIAVVLPTIRLETIPKFLEAWQPLFDKHNVEFIIVVDGETPYINHNNRHLELGDKTMSLISNYCAGVRNLGFYYVYEFLPDVEYIITLDDDETPIGDPIQDHIDQLNRKVPISWLSTSTDTYMRGFPYGIRDEAQVMLSHGVWEGVPDYDAPTQLTINKNHKPTYYQGVVPKGIFTPICGMNLAFRREALPYIYFAPVGQYKGAERFDDIWMDLEVIKDFAELGWAITTGYAKVNHERASNVFVSLEKEAVGIRKNEEYWKGEYDEWYLDFINKRKQWYALCNSKTH